MPVQQTRKSPVQGVFASFHPWFAVRSGGTGWRGSPILVATSYIDSFLTPTGLESLVRPPSLIGCVAVRNPQRDGAVFRQLRQLVDPALFLGHIRDAHGMDLLVTAAVALVPPHRRDSAAALDRGEHGGVLNGAERPDELFVGLGRIGHHEETSMLG